MAILFRADKDFQTALYEGIEIVSTDMKSYGIAKLNGDPVIYLEIDYTKGSEDGIIITFKIGVWESEENNLMRDVKLVKRDYDVQNEEYVDTLKPLRLEIKESTSTYYFLPVPITKDNLGIYIETINGDEPNDLRINIKSQTYRS